MASRSPWTEGLPRRSTLAEDAFKPLLATQAEDFLRMSNGLMELVPEQWSQRQLFHLYRSSTDLETFLDDYGARENRKFFPVREAFALLRWLSSSMSSLVHVDARLASYPSADVDWARDHVGPCIRKAALRLGEVIQACLAAMRENWSAVGMSWPTQAVRLEALSSPGERPRLPRDLIEARVAVAAVAHDLGSAPARIAARFLDAARELERVAGRPVHGRDALQRFMAKRLGEEAARSLEAKVHNLQSAYDSLVAGRADEAEYPELPVLRGSASLALHLLEAATSLTHLYERHDLYGQRSGSQLLFTRLIPEEDLLDITVNTCLVTACKSLNKTVPMADKLLRAFTRQVEELLPLPDDVFLHARPISLIVSVVNHHQTPVEMTIAGDSCSAASIMQMLVLAGTHPEERAIRFSGDDSVLQDLRALFEAGLGEHGFEKLPERLDYLRTN
ncbi:MAG TPA: HPr family phosphocarrier protein [Planctomycetota bacterium]